MAAKNELRQCDHCGKEFKPRVNTQRFCQKQCRWDYNNALKLDTPVKRVESVYTPLHVVEASEIQRAKESEIKPPDVSQGDVVKELQSMIALLKRQIEIYEKQIGIQQQMLDYFLSSGVGFKATEPILTKPIDTSDLVGEVKKSTKAGQSSQNFLNSILALG